MEGSDGRAGDFRTNLSKCEVDGNCYFNALEPLGDGIIEELKKAGHEKNGRFADPGFMDWKNGDFRLKPDSAASAMGMSSIDVREAGIRPGFTRE